MPAAPSELKIRTAKRRIQLAASGAVATAELEDNFHHFRIAMTHGNGVIREVAGEAIRFPWGTCGGSVDVLRSLAGKPLAPLATLSQPERYQHCTHLFDIVSLAVDLVLRGGGERVYRTDVRVRSDVGSVSATVRRDGDLVFDWRIENNTILGPARFEGVQIARLPHWGREHLSADELEAAIVLRRAIHIGPGIVRDLDQFEFISEMGYPSTCYSMQPERAVIAHNMRDVRLAFDWSGETETDAGGG